MRCATGVVVPLLVLAAGGIGCRDNSPPPARVPVPSARDEAAVDVGDAYKPLPPPRAEDRVPPPPFDDPPLVNQQLPEQPAFVNAYRAVGSPRITLFVNRTLEGKIVPVNPDEPIASIEHTRRSSKDAADPGDYRTDTTGFYLPPGQYDEADARSVDYQAIESIMTDWLACDGQVTVISPTMARQRLSDEQVKELQGGRPQALSEVAQQLGADVLVQVQAHPTRQTREGLEVRMIAEALNTRGGESLGRAVVDVPPPLDKIEINRSTRFLARRLMMQMMSAWQSPPPDRADRAPAAPPPATNP